MSIDLRQTDKHTNRQTNRKKHLIKQIIYFYPSDINLVYRTNESVEDEIIKAIGPYEHLLTGIKRCKMTIYCHINRAKESFAHLVLQGAAEGRRGKGRPKTTRLDNIRDWTGMNTIELHAASQDRQMWIETVILACHDAPTIASVTR